MTRVREGKFRELSCPSENMLLVLHETASRVTLFVCVYHAPNDSDYCERNFLELLSAEIECASLGNRIDMVILCGDLNARTSAALDYDPPDSYMCDLEPVVLALGPRASQDPELNSRGQELLSFCKESGFRIVNGRVGTDRGVGELTCHNSSGTSLVDYLLVKEDDLNLIANFEVLNRSESDHSPLVFEIAPPHPSRINSTNENECHSRLRRIRWTQTGSHVFRDRLTSERGLNSIAGIETSVDSGDWQGSIDGLYGLIWYCAESMICRPSSGARQRHRVGVQDWYDRECEVAKENVNRKLRHFRRNRDRANLSDYLSAKKECRYIINRKKQELQEKDRRELLAALPGNNQRFWRLLKKENLPQNANISADQWVSYFSDLFCVLVDDSGVGLCEGPSIGDEILEREITREELAKVIRGAKAGKSGGIDGVPIEIWKNCESLWGVLARLLNTIYSEAVYPEAWRTGIITPIHKKGPIDDPNNYRGITLLPSIAKLLSAILASRIQQWGDARRIVLETQTGFRKGKSTVDNIFVMDSVLQKYISSRGYIYGIFVDFRRAFDGISREMLWFKLSRMGMSMKTIEMLKSIYDKVTACVKLGGDGLTTHFSSTIGLRQGDNLSGILFIYYINDIAEHLLDSGEEPMVVGELLISVLLYADDLCILAQTEKGLQRKVTCLADYCRKWKLEINVSKTKTVVFRKPQLRRKVTRCYVGDEAIEQVTGYSYLGIMFNENARWTQAREELARRGQRAAGALFGNVYKFGFLPPHVMLKLFDAKVAPILTYGAEVWGLSGTTEIEKVATRFYKGILGLRPNSCDTFVRGELGRHTMASRIMTKVIKFWSRLTRNNTDCGASKCYQYQKHLADNGRTSWASQVRDLLFAYGMSDVWMNQGVGSVTEFVTEFSERSRVASHHDWISNVNSFGNLRTYKTMKFELKLEWYLNSAIKRRDVKILMKLRGGMLKIGINEGRWQNVPVENRTCKICNLNVVENEVHFLFECRAYSSFRLPLNVYQIFTCRNIGLLFATENVELLTKVAFFIRESMMFRDAILDVLSD